MSVTALALLIVGCTLVGGFLLSYPIVNYCLYVRFFKRRERRKLERAQLANAYYDGVREEIVSAVTRMEARPFRKLTCTAGDGVVLSARLYEGGADTLVVLYHGAFASPWQNFGVIGEELLRAGCDLLAPDQRAHGESGGKRIFYGEREGDDLLRWLGLLKDFPYRRIALYGVSMGAAAIGFAADRIEDPRVMAIVPECGFTSLSALFGWICRQRHLPRWLLWGAYALGKRGGCGGRTQEHYAHCHIPVLFLHGEEDTVVPPGESEKNFAACAAEKGLLLIPGAGHAVADVKGGIQTRQKIINFIIGE